MIRPIIIWFLLPYHSLLTPFICCFIQQNTRTGSPLLQPKLLSQKPKEISKLNKVKNRLKPGQSWRASAHVYTATMIFLSIEATVSSSGLSGVSWDNYPISTAAGSWRHSHPPKLHINLEEERTSQGTRGQGQIQTPWIHHFITGLARNLPEVAREGWGHGMSFPQMDDVGVKPLRKGLVWTLPKTQQCHRSRSGEFGQYLCSSCQEFTALGVQSGIFWGTRLQAVPVRDLKLILPHPMGLCWPQFLHERGTWLILSLWSLHSPLQKSFPLKISWRLEHFWRGKKFLPF